MDLLRPRAVVVVVKRQFPVDQLLATRDVVAVTLDLSGRQVIGALVYMTPEGPIDTHINLLHGLIQRQVGNAFIIQNDFNAKSLMWDNLLFKMDDRGDSAL